MQLHKLMLETFRYHSTMKSNFCRNPSMGTRLLLLTLVLLALGNFASAAKRKKPVLRDGLFDNSKFKRVRAFSDEFSGRFDTEKWYKTNPRWLGRQPGLFVTSNVRQKNGKLLLFGRYEDDEEVFKDTPEGYEKYTTSFVQTKKKVKYGYFEVRAKPSNSRLSSAFWGSLDTPKRWTEIDVFEIGGGAINDEGEDFRRLVNMNLHVFRDTKKGIKLGQNEVHKPTFYRHRSYLRSRYHTYGVDWSKKYITWTFNGRAIRRDRNKYWHQAFPLKLDVETMPNWFGLPSRKSLPAVYKIRYLRAWSRKKKGKDNVEVVNSSERLSIPLPMGNMFAGVQQTGLTVGSTDGSESEDEDENEGNEDDEAPLEVHSEPEVETAAPRDGLQRAPIPGSNERIYGPVVPPTGGRRWTGMIESVNEKLSDIEGVLIDGDEFVDPSDFDGETVLFRSGLSG